MRSRFVIPPIPDGWFQVAYSDELEPGKVLPLKYFDRDLVLFRTEDGQAKLLDAFCPHLGAHLGYGGKVEGSCIRCPFHAWQFDGAGNCTEVPYAKKIPPKAKMRAWHVHEAAGLILAWHHTGGDAPPWHPPEVPEYQHPEWTEYERRRWQIRTRNQEMAENAVDSAHFHYLHGTSNMPSSQAEVKDHLLRVFSPTGMETSRGHVDGSVESLSYGFGFSVVRFKGIVETLLVSSVTPIDGENVDVRFNFSVKKTGGADITRGVGAAFIKEVSRQLEQDIPIWENKVQWELPVLCDGDGPIGMFRKWCRQFYSAPPATPPREREQESVTH
jgi:phenylpropionate dioxygenase-like ring-hydroxylating dioxygenase large terminal subunit